jgi:16S rRNA (guanine(966)-N(2))-methyltransferase RsmD
MRVIAGQFRSRQLKSLKGLALRPTSDRLRETLFNVLAPLIVGARFLDVFAGTGAIGIEALSRGAAEAVFIESHQPAAALIKQNLASLGIRTGVSVLPLDAVRALEKLAAKATPNGDNKFDLAYIDPPYADAAQYTQVLEAVAKSPLFHPESRIAVEHRRSFDLPAIPGLTTVRRLEQGDAALTFLAP